MDYLQLRSHNTGLYVGLIVFFTLAVTKSRQQDNFYFDPAPRNQDVAEGGEATLRCDVSNRRHITFYWTLGNDDKRLPNTSRRYQEDSNLRILRVSREDDTGSFRCVATNVTTGVSRISTAAQLKILWISKAAEVQLKHPREEAGLAEGVDLMLKCHAEGNPEPHFEWYKNKIRLFSSDRLKFPRNRLKLTSVTAVDNGVYSCKAKSAAGQVTSADNFLLNVPGMNAARLDLASFTRVLLVREGGVAHMHCRYDNAIATDWYFHERKLINTLSRRVTVFANGSLVLNPVRKDDEGIYRCDGISQSGPAQTFTSELVLAYLNPLKVTSFEPKPPRNKPRVVPVDQRYEVRCIIPKGLPTPQLWWLDPRGERVPTTGDRMSYNEGLLQINGAQPSDSGNYTCVVQNMAGEQRRAVWVIVSVPPRISDPPQSTRVEEEGTAEFSCKVVGTSYPVSLVTWNKDDVALPVSQSRFVTDQRQGTLKIHTVRLGDEGNYACVVNTTGHPPVVSNNAHLYVKKKLKFRPPPVNKKLELGSVTKIHCKAEGDGQSDPIVHWLKEGKLVLPAHVDDVQGTLMFKEVTRADAGTYTCVASNNQGVINKTISVAVVVKPRFKVLPLNTTAYEGYPVMLHCVAIGEPTPKIQWDKNSFSHIDQRRFKILSNGSLYVSEVYMEDTGMYGCTAGNTGGLKRTEVYLYVASAEMYGLLTPGGSVQPVENFNMMRTIVIAVCCAVAYLAVVIGLTVYCSIRLIRAKNLRKQEDEPRDAATHGAENGTVPTERTELMDKKERDSSILKSDDTRSHISGISSHPSHSSHSSRRLGYDKLCFPRHDLQTLRVLGKGHYGDVFLAKAHGICDGEVETLVVVKSLLTRDDLYMGEFRREVDMLSKLNHANIVRLLGICREMEPHFLITEYAEWGDLKQFLWAMRKDNSNRNVNLPQLTLAQKTTMCSQIAQGLEYLSNQHFVHRDVATRNILLSSRLDLKLSTLCLCRDIYASEYYPFNQRLIPLRWMAPEAALEGDYSTKSDVWSYGVFMWEVFTLADLPYAGQVDEDVLKGLQRPQGVGLQMPSDCPLEVAQLVRRCMSANPAERPSFNDITMAIGQMTIDSDV